MTLWIPEIPAGTSVAEAALWYAHAGWYVGPAKITTKHPGSYLGTGWPEQSSRDPATIRAWFARWPEAGLFLHLGKSGATGIDIDHPDRIAATHPDFAKVVYTYTGPLQTTRTTNPVYPDHVHGTGGSARRQHLLFLSPPGRRISNSNGAIGKGWGEVRGENGVFIVAPSEHTAVDGRYLWERTGWVQPMPPALAALLRDASDRADAASLAQLVHVRGSAVFSTAPDAFTRGPLRRWESLIEEGASRHESLVEVLPWVFREALAGMYPLEWAEQQLRNRHLGACGDPSKGSGAIRDTTEASAEFDDVAAWALGHASKADPVQVTQEAAVRLSPTRGTYAMGPLPQQPGAASFPVMGPSGRSLMAVPAGLIPMKAQRWLWEDQSTRARWVPLGGVVLLGGREGLGKSTLAVRLAAQVTRGLLPGHFFGVPKSVIVAAGEDAWEQTIVPRLVAAGADMDRVFRIDVRDAGNQLTGLTMPDDTLPLQEICRRHDVALIVLDPLMTVVSGKLDTHKDAEVRKALGPLSEIAASSQVTVLGLIHVSKSKDEDLLTRMMASRAFTAVARAVLFCAKQAEPEPDETEQPEPSEFGVISGAPQPETFLFGQLKNNLAPKVVGTHRYRIESMIVGRDLELGIDIETSRIVDVDFLDQRIQDVVTNQEDGRKNRPSPKRDSAAKWLVSFLSANGPRTWPEVRAAAGKQFGTDTLYKAKEQAGVITINDDNKDKWSMPPAFQAP